MRTHTYVHSRWSRGLESSGQVVKRKNCTRSRGQGSFSAVKNLDRGRKRSYGKHRSDHPLSTSRREVKKDGASEKVLATSYIHCLVVMNISLAFLTSKEAWVVTNTW